MAAEREDLEALRRAVFRREATPEDRARYAVAHAAAGTGGAVPAVVRRGRARRAVVASAVVLLLAGGAAAVGALARPAPPPYPQVASTPIPVLGGDE